MLVLLGRCLSCQSTSDLLHTSRQILELAWTSISDRLCMVCQDIEGGTAMPKWCDEAMDQSLRMRFES